MQRTHCEKVCIQWIILIEELVRFFYQFYFSLFSYSAHTLFDNKLELVICNLGV